MMSCGKCGADTRVLETRTRINCQVRRRECVDCGKRFNTREYDMDYLLGLKEEYSALRNEVRRLRLSNGTASVPGDRIQVISKPASAGTTVNLGKK